MNCSYHFAVANLYTTIYYWPAACDLPFKKRKKMKSCFRRFVKVQVEYTALVRDQSALQQMADLHDDVTYEGWACGKTSTSCNREGIGIL